MTGILIALVGPMFASKTSVLIDVVKTGIALEQKVIVMKPKIDDRYSTEKVVSHDGVELAAIVVDHELPIIDDDVSLVAIDEIQFFDHNIVDWVRDVLMRGINVIVAGLDMDWTGRPFTITASMLAMADGFEKLRAHCEVCGEDASKTWIKVADHSIIEIGSGDKYTPMCNKHWRIAMKGLEND